MKTAILIPSTLAGFVLLGVAACDTGEPEPAYEETDVHEDAYEGTGAEYPSQTTLPSSKDEFVRAFEVRLEQLRARIDVAADDLEAEGEDLKQDLDRKLDELDRELDDLQSEARSDWSEARERFLRKFEELESRAREALSSVEEG